MSTYKQLFNVFGGSNEMHQVLKSACPQIKICGLTVPDEAAACAAMGADAIGLVFHPPSARHLSLDRAAAIRAVLPPRVSAVGVFVDPLWQELSEVIQRCGLDAVQLHGVESQAFIDRARQSFGRLKVIKGLFAAKTPGFAEAGRYSVTAYLVECGRGALPGGNALTWEWGAAADLARRYPTILAGGLSPLNVTAAIAAALPAAVDASSSLEAAPGRKDLRRVESFIASVQRTGGLYEHAKDNLRTVF